MSGVAEFAVDQLAKGITLKEALQIGTEVGNMFVHYRAIPEVSACELQVGKYTLIPNLFLKSGYNRPASCPLPPA